MNNAKTLYDKLWEDHVVRSEEDGTALLYIDRHLVHEVTSPQAFEGLRMAGRQPWRTSSIVAVPDHNVPTTDRSQGITDPVAKLQVETLDNNCQEFGLTEFDMSDQRQGIVHVIGPEQGATLPGMTVVCGDSHTSTHGAFGALAFGIGTSEVEHVLATQTLVQKKLKNMRVVVDGQLPEGVSAKDIILAMIAQIGVGPDGSAWGCGRFVDHGADVGHRFTVKGHAFAENHQLRAVLGNEDFRLFPGLFVRVRIPVQVVENAVLIREDALGTDLGGRFVTWSADIPADPATGVPRLNTSKIWGVGSLHGRYLIGDGFNFISGFFNT